MSAQIHLGRWQRRLALAALVGAVVYVAVDVALRFLRPDLSLLHNAESDYGNGPYAWLMDVNFEIRGLLSLAAAAALWTALPGGRRLGRVGVVLVVIWALTCFVLGFSRDDLRGTGPTLHGMIHLLAAAVGFLTCAVGTLLLTIELARARWGKAAVAAAVIWVIGLLGLLALGHAGIRPHSLGGLYERIFIGSQILWLAVVSGRVAFDSRAGE